MTVLSKGDLLSSQTYNTFEVPYLFRIKVCGKFGGFILMQVDEREENAPKLLILAAAHLQGKRLQLAVDVADKAAESTRLSVVCYNKGEESDNQLQRKNERI